MISLRRRPAELLVEAPEDVALPDEVKKYWREEVDVPNPLADYYPPGLITLERKPRFYVERCEHCHGVHAHACPRVRSIELFENGQVKRVFFFAEGEYDSSSILWAEDVFGD